MASLLRTAPRLLKAAPVARAEAAKAIATTSVVNKDVCKSILCSQVAFEGDFFCLPCSSFAYDVVKH